MHHVFFGVFSFSTQRRTIVEPPEPLEVGAIVTEHGVKDFVNDLQVDLAACCTKDSQDGWMFRACWSEKHRTSAFDHNFERDSDIQYPKSIYIF